MPRNSSGTYSLYTPGNPVVTNTVISSTWANNSLADIASALTDSLSRTGDGGMQAPLELTNGAIGAPALTWASETTSGWYRNGAADFRFSVAAGDVLTLTSTSTTIAKPTVIGAATGGAQGAGTINAVGVYDDGVLLANQAGANPTGTIGLAAVNGSAGTFLRSDGAPALSQAIVPTWTGAHTFTPGSAVNAVTINGFANQYQLVLNGSTTAGQSYGALWSAGTSSADENVLFRAASAGNRTYFRIRGDGVGTFGNATDNPTWTHVGSGLASYGGDINFTVGSLRAVGYRGLPSRSISTSDNTAALDNGRSILFTGAGSQTFTIDSDFGTAENICVILNGGTGALSIAESLSGTMTWLNGSGTLATGTRTLAIGGIATVWMVDATNAYIWGQGLT